MRDQRRKAPARRRKEHLTVMSGFRNQTIALFLGVLALAMADAKLGAVAQDAPRPDGPAAPAQAWDAAAPGRVEPRSREIKIAAPVVARIVEAPARSGAQVDAGDLLIRLDDEEALARLAAAEAQVALRTRLRNDGTKPKGAAADRRSAEDAVADAETEIFLAQAALDAAVSAKPAGRGSDDEIVAKRSALAEAQNRLKQRQEQLRKIKADEDTPLPTRLEGELNVARAELAQARAALEKTRIRAPIGGTVLQVQAQPGEIAMPSPEQALVTLGDLTALRVRAEIDERDIGKVRVGQRAVVRSGAFPGRDFAGTVAAIAPIVGPGRIGGRGPRKLSNVDVLDVVVDLAEPGPLVVGMQVDVYLGPESR
jgi:HlyD family secretion protein